MIIEWLTDLKLRIEFRMTLRSPCRRFYIRKKGGLGDFQSPIGSTKSNENVSNLFIASFRLMIGRAVSVSSRDEVSFYGLVGLFRLSHKLGLFTG